MICVVLLMSVWIGWMIGGDNQWSKDMKMSMAGNATELWKAYRVKGDPSMKNTDERLRVLYGYSNSTEERDLVYSADCGPNKDLRRFSSEDKTKIGKKCKAAMSVLFICWCSPLIGTFCNLFLGVFALLNGAMMTLQGKDDVARLEAQLKRFLGLLALVMMGMYFSASIAGTSVQLGSLFMAFFAAALTVLVIAMYIEIGPQNMKSHIGRSKLSQMLLKAWASDWAKALFIGGFNMMLPTFLILNMMKQKLKKMCRKEASTDKFTPAARKLVDELSTWKWASILVKICLLGELFFTFQVGVAKASN